MSTGPNDKRSVWTAEEQRILEEGLAKHPPQQDTKMEILRHAKITLLLDHKTIIDVADRIHLIRDWTAEEQKILEEGLAEHPPQQELAMEEVRYAKIAEMLENKTVERVAARVQQMKIESQPKPRGRKRKDKEPERVAVRPLLNQDLTRRIQAGDEDPNDSELEKLTKRNAKITNQIKSNLESSDGAMNNAGLFKESLQSLHEMVRLANEDTELPGGLKLPKI